MDAIPVVSQLKSLVQVTFGRREDAEQTQINFSRQCPVVSQARSAVEAIKGDRAAARETQKQFGRFLVGVVNSVPVVGHISGGIHYALGDKDGGDLALKTVSHSTAVMAGGIGGFFIGGPVGAVGLGIAAGVAMDSAITGIDTAAHWEKEKEFRPFGPYVLLRDPKNPGKWFDVIACLVGDGFTAHGAGSLAVRAGMRSGARGSSVRAVEGIETVAAMPTSRKSMTVFIKVLKGVLYYIIDGLEKIGINCLKNGAIEVLVTVRDKCRKIYVWIKNEIAHIKDACGNVQVLQDGSVYGVTQSTGSVEEIHDAMMLTFTERIDLYNHIEETDAGSGDESSSEETEEDISDESSTEETEEESKRLLRQKRTSEAKCCGKPGKSASDDGDRAITRKKRRPC